MTVQEQILSFLRVTGPTLPSKVAKQIHSEILIASAHLSDLAAQGKVKISYLKVGGSPLYYLPGQEAQLYQYSENNLNPKDFEVLENLKEKLVLREASLELLPRVALRSLRDFAIPLQIRFDNNSELFWKWHLLSDEEAIASIRDVLNPPQPTPPSESTTEVQETSSESVVEPLPLTPIKAPSKKVIKNKTTELITTKQENEQRKLSSDNNVSPVKKSIGLAPNIFLVQVQAFFQKLQIVIEHSGEERKKNELSLLVRIPSIVGQTKYLCKAKHKQKCDEKDLSLAYVEAQDKKLPLLFLYTGELTKKAQEMLNVGMLENVIVKRIEKHD